MSVCLIVNTDNLIFAFLFFVLIPQEIGKLCHTFSTTFLRVTSPHTNWESCNLILFLKLLYLKTVSDPIGKGVS